MEVRLPNFDVNDVEAVISEIHAEEGAYVEKGQVLFKVENAKAIREIQAEESGICRLCCKELDKMRVGDILARIYPDREEYEKDYIQPAAGADDKTKARATNKALELARILGVDIGEVARSKNGGLVKTADVRLYADGKKTAAEETAVPQRINPYDRERVLIIGAGKGAEIVIDILMDDRDKYVAGLADSHVKEFPGYSYPLFTMDVREVPDKIDKALYDTVILSMGSTLNTMKFRRELFRAYEAAGLCFTNAIAKSVDVRRAVRIGKGNIIMHHGYIGTGTVIGDNNVISYGLKLGHHCVMGSHNLIAPSFVTAGSVSVGDECVITTGVVTRTSVKIGSRVVLPLGYAVHSDIADDTIIRQADS